MFMVSVLGDKKARQQKQHSSNDNSNNVVQHKCGQCEDKVAHVVRLYKNNPCLQICSINNCLLKCGMRSKKKSAFIVLIKIRPKEELP